MLASLLVLTLPTYSAAEEPPEELETEALLDLGGRSKHTKQVSFGFGSNGAMSALTGTYIFSPSLYARYGVGTTQALWRASQPMSSLTGNTGIAATQFFFSVGSPSLFQFGGGIDVGAEFFMANGPLFQHSLLTAGSPLHGYDLFNQGSSHLMSSWHQRAWERDPLTEGKTWYVQFQSEVTTDSGTKGGRVTFSK